MFEDLEEPTRQALIDVFGQPFENSEAFSYIRAQADSFSVIGVDATLFLHLVRIILKSSDHFGHILALSPALASTFLVIGVPLIKQLVDLAGVARRTAEFSYQASTNGEMWHPPPSCFKPYSAVSILDEVLRTRASVSRHAIERLLSVDSVTELYSASDEIAAAAASPAGSSATHAEEATPDVGAVAFSAPSSPVTVPQAEREPPLPPKRRRSMASRVD